MRRMPCEIAVKMCPSVKFLVSRLPTGPASGSTPMKGPLPKGGPETGPSASPCSPWHGEHDGVNFARPFSSEASVEGCGFGSASPCCCVSSVALTGVPTGSVPSGADHPTGCRSALSRLPVSSKACTVFCHFICGHHQTDHCSQQPVVAPSATTAASARSAALRADKADLLGVVGAQEPVDLGDVAIGTLDHQAELVGR